MASESEAAQPSEDDQETAQLPTSTRFDLRLPVFIPAVALILAFVTVGALFPERLADAFDTIQAGIVNTVGWGYVLVATIFVVFVIALAASRYGSVRLGPDDSQPTYSYFGWFAMLFSAGMGIGLLFFSVAEPISHLGVDPPPWSNAPAGSPEAASDAMVATFFHWGLHAWAIYIVVGLALAYFAFRRGLPLTFRSAFHPLIGDRIYGWAGDAIDTLAIVGTLFGVATSLGIGVTQIGAGIGFLTDMEGGIPMQLGLIGLITGIATLSVVLGIGKGIKRLSELNMGLTAILLVFVLITGPTLLIMNALIQNIGNYVASLPTLSFTTEVWTDGSWQADWTLFYWGWWISWSPFVGMFIARISRGRTIREFITGVLLVPTLVTFVVLTVFGYAGFHSELAGAGGLVSAAEESLDVVLFVLLEQLPLPAITSVLAIVVIATFFITSSDSGSLVDDIHASGGSLSPKRATRIFWALAEGAVAAVLLLAGGERGLEGLQQASIATGVPLALLLLAICVGLVRALGEEPLSPRSRRRRRGQPAADGEGAAEVTVPAPGASAERRRADPPDEVRRG